jgi:hypothetical protein
MGQRLVFECKKDGKRFATLYYHWSGFTGSIYYEALRLVQALEEHGYDKSMDIPSIQKMLLDIVQSFGGGVSCTKTDDGVHPEVEAFKALGVTDIKEDISRNEGLIDITEKGMAEAVFWAEELEEFNFDDETFTNNEFMYLDEGDEEWDLLAPEHPENIPVFNHGKHYIGTVKWSEAYAACQWYNTLIDRFEGFIGKDAETGKLVYVTE